MEIMEIQRSALVVLILVSSSYKHLQYFWNIRGVWHNVDFMMLCYPRTARTPSPPSLY